MNSTITQGEQVFLSTYAQFPLVLTSAQGCYVYDSEGKEYIDMVAGIAVNSLGYKDEELEKELISAIQQGLLHCSNLYWNSTAVEAAKRLCDLSGMERVFFCNSGTEANEAALKLARKFGSTIQKEKTKVISMKQSFHGRTYGSMTLTGQEKYQKAFVPLVGDISYATFNDFDSVLALVDDATCAIFVEPIQGEGGIIPAQPEFLRAIRTLCDQRKILLIFDEVQCGMGRTGFPFAWQHYDVQPDVMTLAKALAAGVPMGAMVCSSKAAKVLSAGDHAATFGGNILSSTAALVMLKRLQEGKLTKHVSAISRVFTEGLRKLQNSYPQIRDIRGVGLMVGMECSVPVRPLIEACMERGMLVVPAGTHVMRFVPPLTIGEQEVAKVLAILESVCAQSFANE